MNNPKGFLFTAGIVLATAFTFSLAHGQALAVPGNLANVLPKGYKIFGETESTIYKDRMIAGAVKGDLNKDGLEDYAMIAKGPKKDPDGCQFGNKDCYLRGIAVAFNTGSGYKLALKNLDCVYSENAMGGNYMPPELSISIKNGNLYIQFDHGRYGNWSYNFRYQKSDFELIGYDMVSGVAGILQETVSINFLSKKMLTKTPLGEILVDDAANPANKFKETWESFTLKKPVKLGKIAKFNGFNVMDYIEKEGILTDSRDGNEYKTVKIGKQIWMSKNLNYAAKGSKCYDNDENNCHKYGRLYDWETAKKACPAGWRLPNDEEWTALADYLGGLETAGKKLKSASGWMDFDDGSSGNGTDEYGFSALPGGSFGKDLGFMSAGFVGMWWSATKYETYSAWQRGIFREEYLQKHYSNRKELYSVRCVRD